ncbi:MAG: hypothetical protein AYK22_02980 [Thermoplasmatales archaeon SG8-52-3]|nr:MAG: hypothetical protein AYK22_02980 [Thermoplasmatales archaeon SG8-52-3]
MLFQKIEVGNIKLKFCTLIFYVIILSFIFSCFLFEYCKAKENSYDISIIGEPTYKLSNTFEKNGRILGKTFQIDIKMSNTGAIKSDEIEINLTDQEGFMLSQKTFFEAGQTKTVSFNWSTMKIINQELIVYYYPSDIGTLWNKYNSGQRTFTIKVSDNSVPSTSTPGFEIFLLFTAIICIIFILNKKN